MQLTYLFGRRVPHIALLVGTELSPRRLYSVHDPGVGCTKLDGVATLMTNPPPTSSTMHHFVIFFLSGLHSIPFIFLYFFKLIFTTKKWHMTPDTWTHTSDTWHLTCDTGLLTCDTRIATICSAVFLNNCQKHEYLDWDCGLATILNVLMEKCGFYNGGKSEDFEIQFLARTIYQYWSRVYQKMWNSDIWGVCFLRKVDFVYIFHEKITILDFSDYNATPL